VRSSAWRFTFVVGLFHGAALLRAFDIGIHSGPLIVTTGGLPGSLLLALGGFLVGVGTRIGNGCTSGHGVCGLGRGSKRSFFAVAIFMTTAVLAASFLPEERVDAWEALPFSLPHIMVLRVVGLVSAVAAVAAAARSDCWMEAAIMYLIGAVFGCGLDLSGMTRNSKVIDFLDVGAGWETWDPSLAFVLGTSVPVFAAAFHRVKTLRARSSANVGGASGSPLFRTDWSLPKNTNVDWRLLTGAAIFGIGWGVSGVGHPPPQHRSAPLAAEAD